MRAADFLPDAPGNLVEIEHDGRRAIAFVPAPLPPRITPTMSLLQTVAGAERAIGALAEVGRKLANPHLLIRPFLLREAELSSRIEGTRASITDLVQFEAIERAEESSDVHEVANYVRALESGLKSAREVPIGAWLIRSLHRQLMDGVRGQEKRPGEFRRIQNFIGGVHDDASTARFVPPPPEHVGPCLDAFERFVQASDELPDLIRLALIHYQFETIHPFVDGNGRIGRLLIALYLCVRDILPAPLLYLSAWFERNRREYCDRMLAVSTSAAWGEWIDFFLRGVVDQAHDAIRRAHQLERLRDSYHRRVTTARTSSLLLGLIDELFARPAITIAGAARRMKVTVRAATKLIEKLVAAKIVAEVTGNQRNRVFVARELVKVLDAPAAP